MVEASRAAGKSIPEDVKLVAQTESTAEVWDVPLSNVSFLGRESGKIAAQALLAAIDGNVEPVVHMPHLFTARASSGA